MISTPASMSTIRTASGESESRSIASIARRPSTEETDEDGVCDRARADAGAERPRKDEHAERDDDVRSTERQRRVLGDSLVEHVPGREAELGLEQEDDPEGEQQQADRERHRPHDDGATNEGRRVHPVSVRASANARSALSGGGLLPSAA